MNKLAYTRGCNAALGKFAEDRGALLQSILSNPNLKRNLNLAGLGLIAAPTLHSLLSEEEDSPNVKRVKEVSDLAGLGLLMGTEFMHH